MSEGFDIVGIERFVRLARAGARPGATRQQLAAAKIARLIDEIGDDFAGMDYFAIGGAGILMQAMTGPSTSEKEKAQIRALAASAASVPGTGGTRYD